MTKLSKWAALLAGDLLRCRRRKLCGIRPRAFASRFATIQQRETSPCGVHPATRPLDGGHLKATLVEVTYGPGASSAPHSHPCPVIVYVVAGALRAKVKGEPEATYHAGGRSLRSAQRSARNFRQRQRYRPCEVRRLLRLRP